MKQALICDALRTPFGRYGGALARIRADDLAALPITAMIERHAQLDWAALDDVVFGCANQAGEDNRNVGRMAALLAGLPQEVSATTVNRLCGSSLDAIAYAARAIKVGEADLILAGGVESMSRAPFVMGKLETAFSRGAKIEDTTMGWRFVNPRLDQLYGTETMPQTAENIAHEYGISREAQDAFALRSQTRTAAARAGGRFADELIQVRVPQHKGAPDPVLEHDEHPRETTLEMLAKLRPVTTPVGTVTAGNASGINDGAGVMLLAGETAAKRYGLEPKARIVAAATAGVAPRIMGIGPVAAVRKLLDRSEIALEQIDVIELNEAFSAQSIAVLRDLGLPEDAEHVNPNGGAIAIGHPLGASGLRLAATAYYHLLRTKQRYALCTMCIGVGQGIALLIERL